MNMEAVPGGSQSQYISLSRNELFDLLRNHHSEDYNSKCEYLYEEVKRRTETEGELSKETKQALAHFTSQFKNKWQASSRNVHTFVNKNKLWLETVIQFPASVVTPSTKVGGRPETDFSSSSERSKRRKTETLRSEGSSLELTYAAQMQLRAEGNVPAADVLKDVVFSTPTRASKYKKAYRESINPVKSYSADKALSIVVGAKLTKFQYNFIRDAAKENNCKMYPNYEAITEARKKCYPDNITITETRAEVPLQSLLDHTVARICQLQQEVIITLNSEDLQNLHLVTKWGCDGSSGMSEYKQVFEDDTSSDANVFLTSLVPLQLVLGEPHLKNKKIVWQNPRPSSPRYCRPIVLHLIHETTDVTLTETQHIEKQKQSLKPSIINLENNDIIQVHHQLMLTMIDGKVCNAISENKSTQRCYLCGATAKDFNKIEEMIKKDIDETKLQFGLSPLHAWIRFFECLLHLSYKLVIRQWQARGDDNKQKVTENKKRIQNDFKSKMGLLIDKPKPGYGSTNDGNTARRFFENASLSAQITEIDQALIHRFRTILLTISSDYPINVTSFKEYCLETAKKFVELYPWYNMPTTVHKILIHSPQILSHSLLPIGQLGEEAQESRNKDIKKYREGYSRKFSRRKTMEDVFHNLLVSSDPYITSMRKLQQKKMKTYPSDVLQFFIEPNVTESDSE